MIVVHLLNDYSGSTSIIGDLVRYNNYRVITSNSSGFIRDELVYKKLPYVYKKSSLLNKIFSILRSYKFVIKEILANPSENFMFSTIIMAPLSLFTRKDRCMVYLMELQHGPKFIFDFAIWLIKRRGVKVFVLSEHMRSALNIRAEVVYPSIRSSFKRLGLHQPTREIKRVLFIGSYKKYKGYENFVKLSRSFDNLDFTMVLNTNILDLQIPEFRGKLLTNITNIQSIMYEHDLVLNLSKCNEWKETLGLTIVEAMYLGKIVGTPSCGAFTEYIDHGKNGFFLNTTEFSELLTSVENILYSSHDHLELISSNAVQTANKFSYQMMQLKNQQNIWSFYS